MKITDEITALFNVPIWFFSVSEKTKIRKIHPSVVEKKIVNFVSLMWKEIIKFVDWL